jgi:hypothetical protein
VAIKQPECDEVKHAVRALDRRPQEVGVQDVAALFEDLEPRILQRLTEILDVPAYELVVDEDLLKRLTNQRPHRVRAIKPPPMTTTRLPARSISLQLG